MKEFLLSMLGRKFTILILGTILLFTSKIDGWQWVLLATAYIGGNVWEKYVTSSK